MKATTLFAYSLGLGGLVFAYLRLGRPRVLGWGASNEEIARPLPGDEILPEATLQTTRAVTIDAPPDDVWPWLVQMGPRPRGGVYTYDWIERLFGIDVDSSDRILPEFQHLAVGEVLKLNEASESGLAVRQVEPNRFLVLQWVPAESTWSFVLERQDDGRRTRLLSRNRLPGSGFFFRLMAVGVMEWASLIMERKMLLGIKERAERLAEERRGCTTPPVRQSLRE